VRRALPWVAIGIACLTIGACGSPPSAPSPGPPQFPTPQPPSPLLRPRLRYSAFLAFGDSLTEGESTPQSHNPATPGVARSYPFKLQALLSERYRAQTIAVFNGGRSGERPIEPTVLPRLVSLLDQLRPDVVLLMHGVNDLNGNVPVAEAVAAVRPLVAEARRRSLPTIVMTLPPQRPGGDKAFAVEQVAPFNQALAAMATAQGGIVLDVFAVFPVELLAPDGLHITQAGNQLIAQVVFEKLRSLYEVALPGAAR
jgi:lysophospholipase L1-like esterase